LSIVAQVVVPGLHTVTLTYGILNVPAPAVAGPGPTVTATLFDAVAPLELLELPEPLELLEVPGLVKLLPELPPPPQPASTHRPSHRVHRKRWLMHQPRY
jgi:hypothetical protein